MKTNTLNQKIEATKQDIDSFIAHFLPFGSRDIERAIEVAKEAGENADWAAEQILSLELPAEDVDPVACIYESILIHAQEEIAEEIGYDIQDDPKHGTIHVHGNYRASCYDYPQSAIDELEEKLSAPDIDRNYFSKKTKWFLEQLGI